MTPPCVLLKRVKRRVTTAPSTPAIRRGCVSNVTAARIVLALEPLQSVVPASSSSHNEGTVVFLPLLWVEGMNADVHPRPGPVAPSLQDDVQCVPNAYTHAEAARCHKR